MCVQISSVWWQVCVHAHTHTQKDRDHVCVSMVTRALGLQELSHTTRLLEADWDRGRSAEVDQGPFFCVCLYFYFFLYIYFFISWRLITLQYCSGFCYTLTWISHGYTCIPHPNPPSHLPLHPIPLGLPSAPGPSTCLMHPTWWSVSPLIIYMCRCCSLETSHPRLLPQGPKVCSIHLCLFLCFAYRVIVTIFLNSIYMR